MISKSVRCLELLSGVNIGRMQLAQQFATMNGWQHGENVRFDDYVQEKRTKQYFEEFDQRVERAFKAALKLHKTEIVNAFKRRLKNDNSKYTVQTAMELRRALEEREEWLRDVWASIDADYRSNDSARQELAAKEISAALHDEPGDYMQWVYETKRKERFLGEKGKAALEVELANASLPQVCDEEVNRYHGLKMQMAEIERNVKTKYGFAGMQHWSELQTAKDDEYAEKLDRASTIFKELLEQAERNDESKRTISSRLHLERVHQAQVRFKAAMALESEREKLEEAHAIMREERKRHAREERKLLLEEAAKLKAEGKTSEEIQLLLRERKWEQRARAQSEEALREQEEILAKRANYLKMIDRFKTSVEEREGKELIARGQREHEYPFDFSSPEQYNELTPQPKRASGNSTAAPASRVNVYGFLDDNDDDNTSKNQLKSVNGEQENDNSTHITDSKEREGQSLSMTNMTSSLSDNKNKYNVHQNTEMPKEVSSKEALWRTINRDVYEDPFITVHQARMDAARTYDPLYSKFFVTSMTQGADAKRHLGDMSAGNEMERFVLQGSTKMMKNYMWGVLPHEVHNLDGDGDLDYMRQTSWHVRDKNTGDIDWRYERRGGGAAFRGPRLYQMGARREAQDGSLRTVDPAPFHTSYSNRATNTASSSSSSTSTLSEWKLPTHHKANNNAGSNRSGTGSNVKNVKWRSKEGNLHNKSKN